MSYYKSRRTAASHPYESDMTTTVSDSASYTYTASGSSSIRRKRAAPANFGAFATDRFYPPYSSFYADFPPVKSIEDVIYLIKSCKIDAIQSGELAQWVFEVMAAFLKSKFVTADHRKAIMSFYVTLAEDIANSTDHAFRRMRRDKSILPLTATSAWYTKEDIDKVFGTLEPIVSKPLMHSEKSLIADGDWPSSRLVAGTIIDINAPGAIYISYSMRTDNSGNKNILAIPAYIMADYLDIKEQDDFLGNTIFILNRLMDIEKTVNLKAAVEKAEMVAAIEKEQQMKEREAVEKNTPKQTTTAKFQIGLFG